MAARIVVTIPGLAADPVTGPRCARTRWRRPGMTEKKIMRDTAVIGLGNMGRGIARNLDRAGRLGAAWDIAEAARTGAELSSEVALVPPSQFGRLGFILFVVPGSAQIEEILPALLARPHAGET